MPASPPAAETPVTVTAAAPAATTSTAPPSTTSAPMEQAETPDDPPPDEPPAAEPAAQSSTTSAPMEQAETPDDPPPDEPPAAEPAAQPSSKEDDEPSGDGGEPEPDTAPTEEPMPEPDSETPLTWQGIPVVDISELAASETNEAPTAPRLLSGFDDVEVLLHDRDRAWTFSTNGSVAHEWSFEDEPRAVFPDGAGGIVHGNSYGIFHRAKPGSDPEILIACPDSCPVVPARLIGLALLGESTEVIYTVTTNHTPDGWEGNPDIRETLHRMSLATREVVSLGEVGGYEWWFGNTSISGHELFGAFGTDGGGGWTSIDLNSGSVGARCAEWHLTESGKNRECPREVAAFGDDMVVVHYGVTDQSVSEYGGATLHVLALRDRNADHNTHNVPLRLPSRFGCIRNMEVWQTIAVINTGAFNDTGAGCDQSYHSVLTDLSTDEVELYPYPGILRLVPRTETAPKTAADTPLEWQGHPAITVAETAVSDTDDVLTAPRLLSRFDDVEVLLHDRDRAWTFNREGSVDKEWTLDESTVSVYPDGAGKIVYRVETESYDPEYSYRSSIHYLKHPELDPADLVECTGDWETCVGLRLYGVVHFDGFTEAVYTVDYWPPLPDDAEYQYPTRTETLYRMDLETRVSVDLVRVGGHEWSFGGQIVDIELRGGFSTDAQEGRVNYDLRSGAVICGDVSWLAGFAEGKSILGCDDASSQDADAFVSYVYDPDVWRQVFVVRFPSPDSASSEIILPLILPEEYTGLYSIETWGSVLVMNTLTREGYPTTLAGGFPHRAVLIDLKTNEIELYSNPGVLRLTRRAASDSVDG